MGRSSPKTDIEAPTPKEIERSVHASLDRDIPVLVRRPNKEALGLSEIQLGDGIGDALEARSLLPRLRRIDQENRCHQDEKEHCLLHRNSPSA